jgi:hypothetical protein
MRLIDFPDVDFTSIDDLKEFYNSLPLLGQIDPNKVVINKQRMKEILDDLYEYAGSDDEQIRIGMLWVSRGPASSKDVPYDKVLIKEEKDE